MAENRMAFGDGPGGLLISSRKFLDIRYGRPWLGVINEFRPDSNFSENKKPVRIAPAPACWVRFFEDQAATGTFAALRRFRNTYPPMPPRRSNEAATWPGSGTEEGSL